MHSPVMYGASMGEIGRFYVTPQDYIQRGRGFTSGAPVYYATGKGLSNIFRGIYSFLAPLIKSGGRVVGKELLKGGAEVLEGLSKGEKPIGSLIKQSAANRIRTLSKMAEERLGDSQQTGSNLRAIKSPIDFRNKLIHGSVVGPKRSAPGAAKRTKTKGRKPVKRLKKRAGGKAVKKRAVSKGKRKSKTPKKKTGTSKRRKTSKKVKSTHRDIFS